MFNLVIKSIMTLRRCFVLILLSTFLCWLSWGVVVLYIDPEETNSLGFFLFYLALLLSLIGTLTLLGFLIRIKFSKELVSKKMTASFRQAIWLSFLVIAFISFKGLGLLRWWNILLLILVLTFLEMFFISYRKRG